MPRVKPALMALALAAPAVFGGCSGERGGEAAAWGVAIDTLNGVVIVSNPAEPRFSGDQAWRAQEDLSIGVVEGDPDYEFSDVRAVEVDEAGRIYVLDGQARRVAVYDSAGVFVRAFGSQGAGPGEFENPGQMTWKGDTLVIWDWQLRRLSFFDRAGNLLRDEALDMPVWLNEFAFRSDGKVWAQRGPSYFMPRRPSVDGVGWLLLLDLEAQSADTVFRWEEESRFAVRTEEFMTVLPIRYAPQLEWTVGPDGRVYAGRGERYQIGVYSPEGERQMIILREYSRYPPSAAERDTAAAWLERLVERYDPVVADRVREAFTISDPKRATGELFVADDGYLWVRTYTEDDLASYTWDVYDPEGRYVSAVRTPSALFVYRITREKIYGAHWDEMSVPTVKRYAIRRPG